MPLQGIDALFPASPDNNLVTMMSGLFRLFTYASNWIYTSTNLQSYKLSYNNFSFLYP